MATITGPRQTRKVFAGRCDGCGRFQMHLLRCRPAWESRLSAGAYCRDCRDWLVRRYEDVGQAGWIAA